MSTSRAALLVVAPLLLLAAEGARARTVAVVVVAGAGSSAATRELRAAVAQLPAISAATESAVVDAQAALVALESCPVVEARCAAKLGALALAELVVVAELRGNAIDAALIDVSGGREQRRAQVAVDARAPSRAYKLLAVRLLAPDLERGRISVATMPSGASVSLDGKLGALTTPCSIDLKPGKHEVYVALPGRLSQTHSVDVVFDGEVSLDLALVADPAAPAAAAAPTPAAAPPPPPPPTAKPAAAAAARVLVLPLRASGVDPDIARTTTTMLTVALQKRMRDIEVISTEDLRAMAELEAEKQLLGCDQSSCLAELAGALGASRVAYGELAYLGGELIVTVSIFDAVAQRAVRESEAVGDEGALRDVITRLVARLAPVEMSVSPLVWVGAAGAAAGLVVGGASLLLASSAVDTLSDPASSGDAKASASGARPLYAIGVVGGGALVVVGAGVAGAAVAGVFE